MKVYKQMKKSTIDAKYCHKNFKWFFIVCFLVGVSLLCGHYSTLFASTNSAINVFSFTRKEENSRYYVKNSTVVASLAMEENSTEVVFKQQAGENETAKMKLKKNFWIRPCSGRYIYIHELPSKFNDDILKNCSTLVKWFDMCQSISNISLGPMVRNSNGVLQEKSWYFTNQFFLEVIFHNKMKNYKCLTNDSSLASAIYVPFYAGLDVGRYLWNSSTSARDASSLDLMKWLTQKPEWKYMSGRDHFFVAGRITWDFLRLSDNESDWGNKLMTLPEAKNMTMLTIESSPWSNAEFAIPYPTYFHPSTERQILDWQNKVSSLKRQYLFSFAGAPRPNLQNSIRGTVIEQCLASKENCKLLDCRSSSATCNDPVHVMKIFQSSTFCLQPPGDSCTRRSTFDSILAGCIPVFFHPETAYRQYVWHLPKNYTKYSVFIPEDEIRHGKAKIEETLLQISTSEVLAMREEVIKLIPKVLYAYPGFQLESFEDAFDIAIKKVLHQVERIRKKMKERKSSFEFSDNERKYNLSRSIGEHE